MQARVKIQLIVYFSTDVIDAWATQGQPYPTMVELLDLIFVVEFRQATPAAYHGLDRILDRYFEPLEIEELQVFILVSILRN